MKTKLIRIKTVHVIGGEEGPGIAQITPGEKHSYYEWQRKDSAALYWDHEITKKGVPNARMRGRAMIQQAEWVKGDKAWHGDYGLYDKDREVTAQVFRDRINELHEQIDSAKKQLKSLYDMDAETVIGMGGTDKIEVIPEI